VNCSVHASGTRWRKPSRCRSRLAGLHFVLRQRIARGDYATGLLTGEQRGESPARARGSTARRVCPRVEFSCRSRRTTSSSEKRAPGGKGVRGREPNLAVLERDPSGARGVDNQHRGGKAMGLGRPEPDVRRGIAGAKVFARWKTLQVGSPVVRSRGRLGGGLGGSHERVRASVTRAWGRRQECQRQGKHTSRREENARREETPDLADRNGEVQPAEANRTVVEQAAPRWHGRASARCRENERCAGTGTKK